jgi:hypothetical protein
MQNLGHERMDDRDGGECAFAPTMPGGMARGLDGLGVEEAAGILPESAQNGINPVMYHGASLRNGVVRDVIALVGASFLKPYGRFGLSLA